MQKLAGAASIELMYNTSLDFRCVRSVHYNDGAHLFKSSVHEPKYENTSNFHCLKMILEVVS